MKYVLPGGNIRVTFTHIQEAGACQCGHEGDTSRFRKWKMARRQVLVVLLSSPGGMAYLQVLRVRQGRGRRVVFVL